MFNKIMRIFILLTVFNIVYAYQRNFWSKIENTQRQGPNVCAIEVNDDINYAYYTESKQWSPRKICGKPTFVRYDCCAGYYKVAGYPGCTGVKPLINLIETTRRIGSIKFAKLIESSTFAEELQSGPPLTLFVPSNEAFDNYLKVKGIRQEWLYNGNRYVNLIANHIVDRRVLSNQWQANLLIPSRLQGNVLRINKFSSGMETVNCHRIIRKDQIATNGVVHVIDGVLDLALAQNSDIIELASRDGRFEIFTKALENSELGNRIRLSEIPCTIFAPTDQAFHHIPKAQLTDMLENPVALNALIAHHIVTHPVCMPNIISEYHASTMQRQELKLNCGPYGPVVDNTNIKNEMYHGKNGLLYVLDRVLLPDRAKTILDVAKEEGLFTFLEIIKAAELEETLRHMKHFTMFAPSETAMYSLSNQKLIELQRNRKTARNFVLNHIVTGTYFTDEISSNQIARTLEIGIPLRFQVYRGNFGIENALIIKADRECSNGVLHVISHILHPAEESLDYILRREGNFSIWLDAMERMKSIQPQIYDQFKRANSSCTYFVPSDEAFRQLGNAKLQKLLEDRNYLTKTLQNHIVDNMLLAESFMPDLQYTVRTKGNPINIMRKNNRILVNDATLVKSDILNKAGVAHEINSVLLPDQCSNGYRRIHDGTITRKVCL
ncbi:transforming growth factor-beta-induced protein ig-h3-like [Frieseomelitta varia]|uniref:transforming growth factor-beta-induced protein ig-h3-like n=1 Tax=Frieseomelitta varia TaxID=561572 RepID=UPI001CB68BB1|nr:transforming growth factor-beta-induced protein ig-h3-like [Frieseomelitta varia]